MISLALAGHVAAPRNCPPPPHGDVADFEIGAAAAITSKFTREHPLAIGGKTGVITNAL